MHSSMIHGLLQALSRTFIHSLWQGLILSVLAALIMICTVRSKPGIRYQFLCAVYLLFVLAVAVTFFYTFNEGSSAWISAAPGAATGLTDDRISGRYLVMVIAQFLQRWSALIVLCWFILVLVKAFQMTKEVFQVGRLRKSYTMPVNQKWQLTLVALKTKLGINKQVSLLESALTKVPVVAGHLKPFILVPVGMLNGLSADHVEAILLHELSHIKRHDYLVNLLQRVTELFLFFNPGMLWVSSLLRSEREHCCDEMAVTQLDNKSVFVEALISFKELSLDRLPGSVTQTEFVMGLSAGNGALLQRMKRIVYERNSNLSVREFALVGTGVMLVMLLIMYRPSDTGPVFQSASSMEPKENRFQLQADPPFSLVRPEAGDGQLVAGMLAGKTLGVTGDSIAISSGFSGPAEMSSFTDREAVYPGRKTNTPNTASENDPRNLVGLRQHQSEKQQTNVEALRYRLQRDSYAYHRAAIEHKQAEADRLRSEQDHLQADLDRVRADKDRDRAEQDRDRAEKDRNRAEQDRRLSEQHREEADRQRVLADKARAHADLDRARAEQERQQAEMQRTSPGEQPD